VTADTEALRDAVLLGGDGCPACPFTVSEESGLAQNPGCLLTTFEILAMCAEGNRPWACHGDEPRICRGYASVAVKAGLPTAGDPILYSRWCRGEDS